MHRRGRIYWLTWALLVLGAAATGVASVEDAFFRGAFGAFLAAFALPLYEGAGPRAAAFLGLVTGIVWQVFLTYGYGSLVWSPELRAYALGRLEIDLSVSAAAFAGAALAAALAARDQRFVRATLVGGTLALAMTALPYGFIRSSEAARLGPVEVTWLAPAAVLEDSGRPWRPKSTEIPTLSADDVAFLRESFLTIDVDGETAVVDTEGRRLWPVWHRRLNHPGHEDGPVRRVFVACTRVIPDEPPLLLALPESPEAACALELSDSGFKVVSGAATLADPETLLNFRHESEFQRLVDTYLRHRGNQPIGLHAPAFLRLDRCHEGIYRASEFTWNPASIHNPVADTDGVAPPRKPTLWMLRRTAMETPGEAAAHHVAKSESFYGFSLTMPAPKPVAGAGNRAPSLATRDELIHPRIVTDRGSADTSTLPELAEPAPAAK